MRNDNHQTELPPLIDLPVYRGTYMSQQRTDELCRLLWQQRPDLIRALVEREEVVPQDRTMFARVTSRITEYFREEEKAGRIEAISLTSMVDLIYEIDRRVRQSLGLPAIPVRWKPIAPGPDGPFPPWPDKPIYSSPEGNTFQGLTQEKADRLTPQIYAALIKECPEAIFAQVENERRHLRSCEANSITGTWANRIVSPKDEVSSAFILSEFNERLRLIFRSDE
jgi:hypothetical protein